MRNRFPAWCCDCRAPIPPEAGWLIGKSESTGKWEIRCQACESEAARVAEDARVAAEAAFDAASKAEKDRRDVEWKAWEREAWQRKFEADELHRRIMEFAFRLQTEQFRRYYCPPCLAILGLRPPVDAAAIKKAYRSLALVHHPDKGGSQAEFIKIRTAYTDAMRMVGGAA